MEKLLNRDVRNVGGIAYIGAERMSISEIAKVLEVSKSFLYGLAKAYPAEVPKSRQDLELWAAFVNRYRIEPTGNEAGHEN